MPHISHENNQSQPPTVLFRQLSDSEKEELLNTNGYLHGVRIDSNDGPRKSIYAAARYKVTGQHHSPIWIEEQENTFSETLSTQSSRISNYVHCGWSIDAASTITPWAASRQARHHEADHSGGWTTKRITAQRLSLEIPSEDLVPSQEFQADVHDALGHSTFLGKFQALDMVFQRWGDVMPIAFELGASLAISDLTSSFAQLSLIESDFRINDLVTYKNTRVHIKGVDTSTTPNEIVAWLSEKRQPSQWSVVRVTRVIPTVSLLQNDLKRAVKDLYSNLLSYLPLLVEGNSIGVHSFDGTPYALKTIKSISVRANTLVDSLSVIYADGTSTGPHGGPGGNEQIFYVRPDESILEVVLWTDPETLCGIQFVTNQGRISPHYGGDEGIPNVLNCEGGALSAFSGRVKHHSYWKNDMVYRIQTIWRHDLVLPDVGRRRYYSTYIGGTAGTPFNDWPYQQSQGNTYISEVTVQGEKYIESIQATYSAGHQRDLPGVPGPRHGVKSSQSKTFSLRPGEYFVKVKGRREDWIVQLSFITNLDLLSPTRTVDPHPHSATSGEEFECEAPPGMRLCYIMGKSSTYLHGLMFVWATIKLDVV